MIGTGSPGDRHGPRAIASRSAPTACSTNPGWRTTRRSARSLASAGARWSSSGADIGNFIEIKQATIGRRVKAHHVGYIGDATVGEGANIGAGAVTCNYDGVRKHQTRIGARAFVGTNASLVAPLTIGDDAYVGAGSVITQDVPPGALAVERAPQVVGRAGRGVDGRVRERRPTRPLRRRDPRQRVGSPDPGGAAQGETPHRFQGCVMATVGRGGSARIGGSTALCRAGA